MVKVLIDHLLLKTHIKRTYFRHPIKITLTTVHNLLTNSLLWYNKTLRHYQNYYFILSIDKYCILKLIPINLFVIFLI